MASVKDFIVLCEECFLIFKVASHSFFFKLRQHMYNWLLWGTHWRQTKLQSNSNKDGFPSCRTTQDISLCFDPSSFLSGVCFPLYLSLIMSFLGRKASASVTWTKESWSPQCVTTGPQVLSPPLTRVFQYCYRNSYLFVTRTWHALPSF